MSTPTPVQTPTPADTADRTPRASRKRARAPAAPSTRARPTTGQAGSAPTVSLVISGGNALGAYAAGAVEALEAAGVRFDVISGASIGAITAAIVAGNPPGQAGAALRAFWAQGSGGTTGALGSGWPWAAALPWPAAQCLPPPPARPSAPGEAPHPLTATGQTPPDDGDPAHERDKGETHNPNAGDHEPDPPSATREAPALRELREINSAAHALHALLFGRPGLFSPNHVGLLQVWPSLRPMALFDARPVVQTLERLIDFDYLHTHGPRLIVCAVDLETGEPVYFDSRRERITPQHLLASTAFMPSFPPVEIDGRLFGDPGLSCNLPLDPVLQFGSGDRLCFAVDHFSGAGLRPQSLDAAVVRAQDVLFSAQSTRALLAFRREHALRHQLQQALQSQRPARPANASAPAPAVSPPGDPDVHGNADPHTPPGQVDMVLSVYQPPEHEIGAKTLDFSAAALSERWAAGQRDMAAALAAQTSGQADVDELGFRLYRSHPAQPAPAAAPATEPQTENS